MDGLDPFDGDEEAALRYAIALSLQEVRHEASNKPIELSSDVDDDLDKGPKYPSISKATKDPLTKQSIKASPVRKLTKDDSQNDIPPTKSQPCTSFTAPSSFSTLGLDRKKMEEERLARLGKRKAPESEADPQPRRQKPKLDSDIRASVSSSRTTLATKSSSAVKNNLATESNSVNESSFPSLPYPKGVVKKTWAAGYPRADDIKIEEVLQKNELEVAVVSSFQWDEEWMLSKIDFKRTKVVCVAFASSETQKKEIQANAPRGASVKFCFPPMMPTGNMHSKLQLLKYPTYLRIVVPSGNLVPYDWGETGVIENTVFLIDLPLIEDPELWSSNDIGAFGEELCYFLRAQGLEESLVNSLAKYDFSEANRYRFVHTIVGSHVGDKWQRTGYCGLGRAVTSLKLKTAQDVEVDFVASSLGSVNMDLLLALYYAAQGDNGLKEYDMRSTKGRKNKPPTRAQPTLDNQFRIYFPSHDTVMQSRGGKNAAGTICAQSKWWDAATFPRELIRDCQSVRSGLLIHSKIMMVQHSRSGTSEAAYAYVGSANLSESAWGRLTKERGTGNPKLTCRNWECGVIVPIPPREPDKIDIRQSPLSDFYDAIHIPMKVPGESYGATKSKRPWLFLEN
ncbi:phospholipase D/nuclease [Hypoxylon sp. FL1150]|nr:phospholipase D/nuclease [Hypoxylon sp. FL1150]